MQKYLNILSKPIVVVLLKAVIFLGVVLYVFRKISSVDQKDILVSVITTLMTNKYLILIPILLVFVNWGIEAWKWQFSAKPVEEISYKTAVFGVLSGLNIGILLPQAFGDYAGRIWHLKALNRTDAISSVFLCHFSQFFSTCLGALIGAIIFYFNGLYADYIQISFFVALVFISGSVLLLLTHRPMVKNILNRFTFFRKNYHYVRSIIEMDPIWLIQIFALSFLRYLCFLTQFVIVLKIFAIPLSCTILGASVMLVFFLKSIVPSFNFLADLGIREFSALAIFSVFGTEIEDSAIVSASLVIWLINLFFPSILGVFTVFSLKIFPRTNER